MKRLFLLLTLFALVVGQLFIPSTSSFGQTWVEVSQQDAIKVGKNFLKMINEWQGSDLRVLTNLYDYDGNLTAYYIVAEKDGKEIGNLVVSATKDKAPVMEYGSDSSYTKKVMEQLNVGNKVYYLGAEAFYGSKSANVKLELEKKLKEKKDKAIAELKKEGKDKEAQEIEKMELKKLKTSPENETRWSKLLADDVVITPYSLIEKDLDYNKIPFYNQNASGVNNKQAACGPAVGAMMTEYYKNIGFNIRGESFYSSAAGLINHMYGDMGTFSCCGTTAGMFEDGLDDHFEHRYGNAWTTNLLDAEGNFATVRQWIDGNAPLAALDGNPLSWAYEDIWHWRLITGYALVDGYPYVDAINPAGSTTGGPYDGFRQRNFDYYQVDGDWTLVTIIY